MKYFNVSLLYWHNEGNGQAQIKILSVGQVIKAANILAIKPMFRAPSLIILYHTHPSSKIRE